MVLWTQHDLYGVEVHHIMVNILLPINVDKVIDISANKGKYASVVSLNNVLVDI